MKKIRFEFILIAVIMITVVFLLRPKQHFTQNDISSILGKDTLLTLKDWYLVYPNTINDESENKFFQIEQSESLENLYNLCTNDTTFRIGAIQMPNHMIDIGELFKGLGKEIVSGSHIYMACNIKSPENMQAVLSATIFQSSTVYLNGERVYTLDFRREPSKFREEFIPVQLRKGENYLLMKINIIYSSGIAWRWKVLVDCINPEYANELYETAYYRHFLKRSILPKETDTLKIYTGPHCNKPFDITVKEYHSDSILLQRHEYPDKTTGTVKVNLENKLSSGLYTCCIKASGVDFRQTFFVGHAKAYFDSTKQQIYSIPGLPEYTKLDLEALARRISFIDESPDGFDDIFEPRNRIIIPCLEIIHNLPSCIDENKLPDSLFFIKSYHSDTMNKTFHYSAHIPKGVNYGDSVSIFVMLYHNDKPTEWVSHWRNYTNNGLSNVNDIADRNNFIMVWTNCGGLEPTEGSRICEEILSDLQNKYQLTKDRTFLLGNCASTKLAHDLLIKLKHKIGGIGFINPYPISVSSEFLEAVRDKKAGILCAYHDEEIPFETNQELLEAIQSSTPVTKMIVSKEATHHINPENYIEPLLQWLDIIQY